LKLTEIRKFDIIIVNLVLTLHMRISFVIPAYNEENYLGRCLDSIMAIVNQKKHSIEVIVVNNASTDKTREVALSYPGIRLIDEPRKGLSQARQAGFSAATGDLIANIDADIIVPEDWTDTVLESFATNDKLVGLSGPHVFYDVSKWTNYSVRFFYYCSYVIYLFNRFIFRVSSMLQGGNFVIRRSALDKIGGFNTDFSFYGEDADIAHRLHKVGDVKFTFKLPVYASGRRVISEGKVTLAFRYFINYIWAILFGRPFTKSAADIRLEAVEENDLS